MSSMKEIQKSLHRSQRSLTRTEALDRASAVAAFLQIATPGLIDEGADAESIHGLYTCFDLLRDLLDVVADRQEGRHD